MTRALTAALALLAGAIAPPAAAAADVVFATWNVQNYLLMNRFPDGAFRPAYPMPEAQKALIRQQILAARPDLLFLQELGSAAFLRELQLDLRALGLDYPHASFAASPDARTGLAVLSRLPLDEVVFHDPLPLPNGQVLPRGVQEVRLHVGPRLLRFYQVHLKSRFSDDPADPDAAQARAAGIAALAAFLDRQLAATPGADHVLLGDFNTPVGDPLLAPLRSRWSRLPVPDSSGQEWTYQHRRSGSREILDAAWIHTPDPAAFRPAGLLPDPPADPAPSDHRFLLVRLADLADRYDWSDKKLATPP